LRSIRREKEVIRLTAEQIIKDFTLFGMEITFSGMLDWAYEELFEQMLKHITHLMAYDHQKLLSLLYQIDPSEKKVIEEYTQDHEIPYNEILTRMIIEREIVKVLTRLYFKDNSSRSGFM
jgi:hypothetical protein